MSLLKSNGLVSYESVGKLITSLPKDKWIPLKEQLDKINYEGSLDSIMPAFNFFEDIGHVEIKDKPTQNILIQVLSVRKSPTKKTEQRKIMNKVEFEI